MSRELTNSNNSVTTDTQARANKALSTYLVEPKAPRQISRTGLSRIHQKADSQSHPEDFEDQNDLRSTAVGKAFNLAKNGLKESLDSGLRLFSNSSGSLIDKLKNGESNKNIKGVLMVALGGIFGLKTIQGLFDFPKRLSSKNPNEQHAPFLISAAKWVTGGTLAYGAIKAFTTGVGISNPAIALGIGIFAALSMVTSAYENENSLISKFLNILGLRDRIKSITNEAQVEKLVSN